VCARAEILLIRIASGLADVALRFELGVKGSAADA